MKQENQDNQEIIKGEIKKEFQLERMILFSDAVFAIVITLMAIEIHLPEHEKHYTEASFFVSMKHLMPTIFAYALSFFFVGQMWYKHLKMFSLLKDYNKGLVIRNLIFLFFIGLFPFGASLIVSGKEILSPTMIYVSIIMCCMAAQMLLHDYIINRGSDITIHTDLTEEKADLKRRILTLTAMACALILAYITSINIELREDKSYAFLWLLPFALCAYFINIKKPKKAIKRAIKESE